MPRRANAVASELKLLIRLAKKPEELNGKLPELSQFALVRSQGEQSEEAQTRFIIRTLVPVYAKRLPENADGRAIRELLRWKDDNGHRTLDVRYRAVAEIVHTTVDNVARRKEDSLLTECARAFIDFDLGDAVGEARNLGKAPPIPPEKPAEVGIVNVYPHLDYYSVEIEMRRARQINLLSTFIPAFEVFFDAIREALSQGADVRILMVHPNSRAASMRTAGLSKDPHYVKSDVEHCLRQLARLAEMLNDDARGRLGVRLYDSLPSIAVYNVDDHSLLSVFLHDQLAIHAPQIELYGRDSLLGKVVYREFMTLWDRSQGFSDIRSWNLEIDGMLGQAEGET